MFYFSYPIFRRETKEDDHHGNAWKVRRLHLRDKLSLHEIAKRTGLSRNTVRKWLRTAKGIAEPAYQRKAKPGKLTPFHGVLELALKADAHRIKQGDRKYSFVNE